jgi:hypothetical protein
MTQAAVTIDSVEALLNDELSALIRDFELTPIPHTQDLRGFLICWFAAFAPELVSEAFRYRLKCTVHECRSHDDFDNNAWFRITHLESALFALDDDTGWIDSPVANLNHDKASLRFFVHESLAFVADKLEFVNQSLRRAVEYNLKVVHGFCEHSVVLLCAASGQAADKRRLVAEWASRYRLNQSEEECLRRLADGRAVPNTMFAAMFSKTHAYVASRLLEIPPGASAPSPHLPFPLDGRDVYSRTRKHPLTDSWFEIR